MCLNVVTGASEEAGCGPDGGQAGWVGSMLTCVCVCVWGVFVLSGAVFPNPLLGSLSRCSTHGGEAGRPPRANTAAY